MLYDIAEWDEEWMWIDSAAYRSVKAWRARTRR
jgi:hypothetical protein